MLIKEISEELAVIIINNNKVLNFPLKKSSWKEWNKFLGQLQLLQDLQQWGCLCWFSGSYCSPCHCRFAFLLKCFWFFFLDSTSCRLVFGLPSPLRSPVAGDVSGAKHILAGSFQQPRALPAEGMEFPTAFLSYLVSTIGCGTRWHSKHLQASHLAFSCQELPISLPPTIARHLWPHVLSMMSMCRHLNSSWAWQCPCQVSSKVSDHKFTL